MKRPETEIITRSLHGKGRNRSHKELKGVTLGVLSQGNLAWDEKPEE